MPKMVIINKLTWSVLLLFIAGCEFVVSDKGRSDIPVILQHPASLIVNLDDTAVLSVVVQGTDAVEYQWIKEGVEIALANSDTLTLTDVTDVDSARYQVEITNSYGSVISNAATLLIEGILPRIVGQPVNVFANTGNSVSFAVEVLSVSTVTYQWQKDNADLNSQNSANLQLNSISPSDEGIYQVQVDNDFGGLNSDAAFLSLTPKLTKQPVNLAGQLGEPLVLSAIADGGGTLSYQWHKDGIHVGQNIPTYAITSLSPSSEGQYWLEVSNQNGSVVSNQVDVTIISAPIVKVDQYTPKSGVGLIDLLDDIGMDLTNMSGITWEPVLGQYLVVNNGDARVYKYSFGLNTLNYEGVIHMSHLVGDNVDIEGVSYIGAGQALVSAESNVIYKINFDGFTTEVDYDDNETVAYQLPENINVNSGLEAVAYSLPFGGDEERIYTGQEQSQMKVYQFDMPDDPAPITNTPINYLSSELDLEEPFEAEDQFNGVITDIAGMVFDERTRHLLILSQESCKVLQVLPDTGAIVSELTLFNECNPQISRPEGITIGLAGELIVVREPNKVQIYELP